MPATPAITKQEREMFLRLNRDRKERGLPALAYDEKLADVARFHSADMRDHRFFDHESPNSGSLEDRLAAAGYLFLNARENLSEAPNVQLGQDSLLESPGHYANIVATDVTHIGIGIVPGGVAARENLTITQVFARPGRTESTEEAEAAIRRRIDSERSKHGLGRAQSHSVLEELAKAHIAELDVEPSPSNLQAVGQQVTKELSERQDSGLRGVTASAQLLPDSDAFALPQALVSGAKAPIGLAVRTVKNESGRPLTQVLLLVGK